MRKNLVMAAMLAAMLAWSAPAEAQQAGTIELGGFGKWTRFDGSFNTPEKNVDGLGAGGRLGFFFGRHLALEADGSGNETDVNFFQGFFSTPLTYYPFHLRLVFNQKLAGEESPLSFLFGGGPAYNRYGRASTAAFPGLKGSDWGLSGLVGFRLQILGSLALRVDGTIDFIPSPNNGKSAIVNQGIRAAAPATKNLNLGAQAGVSWMLGLCNRRGDGTTISPATATVTQGQTLSFVATATHCGKPDLVDFTVGAPGSIDASGVYSATGVGTATVSACGQENEQCSTATVTIVEPPPPPPPPPPARTLVRCEVVPANPMPRIDQPVTITVTCIYSDGTRETVQVSGLVAPGAEVVGNAISFSTPGTKNVTVVIPGDSTLTTMVDVQQIKLTVSDSAFFQFDKTEVYRPQDQRSLNEVAETLKQHPEIKLAIDGHADSDGSVAYNEKLAMNRAIAVRKYFVDQGVPVERMTIVLRSFGECVPVAPNNTAAGRTLNRRAELLEFGRTPPAEGSAVCAEAGRERKP